MRSNRMIWSLGVLFLVLVLSACGDQLSGGMPRPEPREAEQATAATYTPSTFMPVPLPGEGTPTPSLRIVSTVPVRNVEEATMPMSPTIPIPASPGLQKLVLQAKEDLAQRLSIQVDQIDLVELKAVVWPDGGLGCPEPGVVYAQVQQEGLLIRLRAGKRIYPYHSGGGTLPFLCTQAIADDTP
jgi:hypothetical protein